MIKILLLLIMGIGIVTAAPINNPYSFNLLESSTESESIETFLELTDTPSSYIGEANNCVKVNGGEDALVFGDCGNGTSNMSQDTNISNFTEYWITDEGSLDTINSTQFENNAGTLSIIGSWLESLIEDLQINPFDQSLNTTDNVKFNEVFLQDSLVLNQTNDAFIGFRTDSNVQVGLELVSDPFANATIEFPSSGGAVGVKTSSNVWTALNYFTHDVLQVAEYITHYGDTNTKFGFPSNDAFDMWLGGIQVLSIDRLGGKTSLDLYDADIEINVSSELRVNGDTTINGTLEILNDCGMASSLMWAEESGATSSSTNGGLQYSFGNGNTNAFGIVQPCPGTIVSIGVAAENANNGDGLIAIVVNGASTSVCNVSTPTAKASPTYSSCDLSFSAGDQITARTITTPTGTNNGYTVSWGVRYD